MITAKIIALKKELKFDILSRGDINGKGLNLQILVPTNTSKDKALNIAKKIKSEFPKMYLDVGIFDSREAYQNRDNDKYPEKKFMKHYLVQVNVNPTTGFDEIKWIKK